jgi:hypothetical protein
MIDMPRFSVGTIHHFEFENAFGGSEFWRRAAFGFATVTTFHAR